MGGITNLRHLLGLQVPMTTLVKKRIYISWILPKFKVPAELLFVLFVMSCLIRQTELTMFIKII